LTTAPPTGQGLADQAASENAKAKILPHLEYTCRSIQDSREQKLGVGKKKEKKVNKKVFPVEGDSGDFLRATDREEDRSKQGMCEGMGRREEETGRRDERH
jgi:hypothetical protein